MPKILTYQDSNGRYSVVCGLGIIAQGVDRKTAISAILATVDVSESEASIYLDSPASAPEFRSAWAVAVGNSIVASGVAAAQREQTIGLLTTISIQLAAILDRFERQDTREAVAALQVKVLRLVDQLKADMAAKGIDNIDDAAIIRFLLDDGESSVTELQELLTGASHD